VNPITSHTCKLTDPQAGALQNYLRDRGTPSARCPTPASPPKRKKPTSSFTKAANSSSRARHADFVEFVLEPQILQEATLGYETILHPELLASRIGVDESGKGDFFGPLCVAGVYVNESVVTAWKGAGIRDSKDIGSDAALPSWPS